MSELVSAPPPSGGINWEEMKGKLLIFEPKGVEVGIQTQYGLSDAVRADIHALVGPDNSEDYNDCLIFPKLLQSQLRSQVGKRVVGRIAQGNAKGNQSPPWIIEAATDDDIAKAKEWLAKRSPSLTAAAPPF